MECRTGRMSSTDYSKYPFLKKTITEPNPYHSFCTKFRVMDETIKILLQTSVIHYSNGMYLPGSFKKDSKIHKTVWTKTLLERDRYKTQVCCNSIDYKFGGMLTAYDRTTEHIEMIPGYKLDRGMMINEHTEGRRWL